MRQQHEQHRYGIAKVPARHVQRLLTAVAPLPKSAERALPLLFMPVRPRMDTADTADSNVVEDVRRVAKLVQLALARCT